MRVSLIEAFEAQGVALTHPRRSWSGTRHVDGSVVLAIREHDVQTHAAGFSCLLWAPVIEGATEWVDRPTKRERLQHCRLAYMHGQASGLIVHAGSGAVERGAVLTLRIDKRLREYWATWGSSARAQCLPRPKSRQCEALFESPRLAA